MRRTTILVSAYLMRLTTAAALAAGTGELELTAIDERTGEPTAVRVELRDERGRSIQPGKLVRAGDSFRFDGTAVLTLAEGRYQFQAEKGLEYRPQTGSFLIRQGAADNHQLAMKRFVDMAGEGWWSGDLNVTTGDPELPLEMLSEDLRFAVVSRWGNQLGIAARSEGIDSVGTQRLIDRSAGIDQRPGAALQFFRLANPLTLPPGSSEFPSSFDSVRAARAQPTSHLHLADVTSRDLPVWLASGQLDSVGLFHAGFAPTSCGDSAASQPRDRDLFPDPDGAGWWAQHVYSQVLESGFQIPPAAGSGAGTAGRRLGYNRVYVHGDSPLTADGWWDGLRQGRVVVTNGPMLRPRVNGELPGHVFHGQAGEVIELDISLELATREKIEYLEILQNGRPVVQVRLEEYAQRKGELPVVKFTQSGWLMVRVVANAPGTFRAACSGPYYVLFDRQPRISRQACQFFLDWTNERTASIRLADARQQEAVIRYHRAAQRFWEARLEQSNAE